MYKEIPSDDAVVAALTQLGGSGTAKALCDRLVAGGHPRPDSQLAIQRAVERGRLSIRPDWSLTVVQNLVAA